MPRKRYDKIFTEECLRELYSKTPSSNKIAQQFGCSHKTVLNYLYEFGIVTKGEANIGRPICDKVGMKSGDLEVIRAIGQDDRSNVIWECLCVCGKTHKLNNVQFGKIKSCGCSRLIRNHKGVYEHYLNRIIDGAKSRNLIVSITLEDIGDLLEKQEYKCALTGWPIQVSDKTYRGVATASLDRINSEIGYTKKNIQWVHKDVNRMKQYFSQNRFIEVCKAVCKNNVALINKS